MSEIWIEKIHVVKRENLLIRLIVLTFLGGVHHSILLLVLYWSEMARIIPLSQVGGQNPPPAIFSAPWYFIFIYLGSLFAYCLTCSVIFKEKRTISPVLVQTVTAGVSFAVIATGFFAFLSFSILIQDYLVAATLQLVFQFYIFFTAAFVMNIFLRKLIGYNGTRQDLHELTMILPDVEYAKIRELLTSKFFLDTNELDEVDTDEEEDGNLTIVKSHRTVNPQVTIVLTPDEKDTKSATLSLCSYQLKYNSIVASDAALTQLRNMKGALIEQFRTFYPKLEDKEPDSHRHSEDVAAWEALRITRSRVSGIEKPKTSVIVIVSVTLAIGSILTLLILNQSPQTPDATQNSLITIWTSVVAVVASALVSLALEGHRPRRRKKKLSPL